MPQQPILNEILRKIPSLKAHWEIYFLLRKSFSLEGKDFDFDKDKMAVRELFSIRVLKDSKMGFATCTSLDRISDAFDHAIMLAENSDPDEFSEIPEPGQLQDVHVYDGELEKVKNNLKDFLLEMQKGAFEDKRVKKLRNSEVRISFDEKGFINSKGLEISYKFSQITAHIMAIAEDLESQMGWSYKAERFLKNVNFFEIGRDAATKATLLLNGKKIKSFKGYGLIIPAVAVEFLELVCQSLSAENFLLGKSIFINKMDKSVINDKINIIDDGLLKERFGSTPFDGEGVPTKRKLLIEKGILKGLMHNCYTAKRSGLKSSTGNALRTERGISVGPTNLYLDTESRKYSFEELLKIIDRGIYVIDVMGMHTANPISGDFSVGAAGLYIEKGEIKYPLKEVVISGNIGDFFKNITAIGEDLTFYGNVGSPTLLVEGLDISG